MWVVDRWGRRDASRVSERASEVVVGCEDGKGAADTRALGIRWTRDTRPARGGGVLSPCRYVPVCPFQVEVGLPFLSPRFVEPVVGRAGFLDIVLRGLPCAFV